LAGKQYIERIFAGAENFQGALFIPFELGRKVGNRFNAEIILVPK
jgi:hypothetical protein